MRGLLAADQFLWADAIGHLQRALAAQPQLPDLHLALGKVWLAQKRPSEAAAAFERARELDPQNPAASQGLDACAAMTASRPFSP
jgi:cytochrome c-type biogenesis protein CcmH/NrfG